jgi:L-malate glycosyltransferase
MKILFYNHTGQVSGAERVLLTILTRLNRRSFEATVLCPSQGQLTRLVAELGVATESIAQLEARFTWRVDRLLRYLKSFPRVIRDLRHAVLKLEPDLIHANSIRAGLLATAATIDLEVPVAWHLHDILPRHPFSTAIRLVAGLSRKTQMIAISQAVAKNFLGRFSWLMKDRLHVVLNAVDLAGFADQKQAAMVVRDELGLVDDDLLFGIVGQLTPRKGQLELIRAFARTDIPHAKLAIVGAPVFDHDHNYALALRQEVTKLGLDSRVRLLGPRSDIGAVMQALDLLVVNSNVEAFGLVLLEAMACGTPVLAGEAGGIPEIIEHGQNGWLVPARNEPALAEALVYLSQDAELRSRLAEKGKQTINRRFTIDRYMNELEMFYQSHRDFKSKSASTQTVSVAKPREELVPDAPLRRSA